MAALPKRVRVDTAETKGSRNPVSAPVKPDRDDITERTTARNAVSAPAKPDRAVIAEATGKRNPVSAPTTGRRAASAETTGKANRASVLPKAARAARTRAGTTGPDMPDPGRIGATGTENMRSKISLSVPPKKPIRKTARNWKPGRKRESSRWREKNAVWEALKSGKHLDKLLLAQGMDESGIQPLIAVAARSQTRIERVPKAVLDRYSLRGKHQGILAFLPAMEYAPLEETLSAALEADPNALFVLLDEVQDPHNVGAIVRSAYCAGAAAVLVPQHRTSGMTATVAKASAGAISHIPVCRVTNLVRLIENLQEKGVRVLGADMEGEDCFKANLTGPLALVIGNEGEGLRRLVKESCDGSVAIPLKGEIDSLNASVAAGILLFEAVRQRSL